MDADNGDEIVDQDPITEEDEAAAQKVDLPNDGSQLEDVEFPEDPGLPDEGGS
jgi:hypothetical protein